MDVLVSGRCWRCGNNVTSYDIIPEQYWAIDNPEPDTERLAQHVFEGIGEDGKKEHAFRAGGVKIVVAGVRFGCGGKSIIHPVLAIKHAGIQLVIAESFSRYFFRNAVNLALPVMICRSIHEKVSTGDELSVCLETGVIENKTKKESYFGTPVQPLAMRIAEAGGAINYYCHRISEGDLK